MMRLYFQLKSLFFYKFPLRCHEIYRSSPVPSPVYPCKQFGHVDARPRIPHKTPTNIDENADLSESLKAQSPLPTSQFLFIFP